MPPPARPQGRTDHRFPGVPTLLACAVATACGGKTATPPGEAPRPPAALFAYGPESVVEGADATYENTTTYQYDGQARLVTISERSSMPETPRVVQTLSYGPRGRLEEILSETFWSVADPPSDWTRELRRYGPSGLLERKEIHRTQRGGYGATDEHTVLIERDADARPLRISRDGETLVAFEYDAASGHVRTIRDGSSGSVQIRELVFDESDRLIEQVAFTGMPGATQSRSAFLYDAEGFVSHACTTLAVATSCEAATADTTIARTLSPAGEPVQLTRLRATDPARPWKTVVRYTAAGTSVGLQQLEEGWPVRDYVLGVYGRGEIETTGEGI